MDVVTLPTIPIPAATSLGVQGHGGTGLAAGVIEKQRGKGSRRSSHWLPDRQADERINAKKYRIVDSCLIDQLPSSVTYVRTWYRLGILVVTS